jgi:predicted tellurium resistance membrane protein TerC
MPGRKRGRLTAIIVNIFGTILTIYLLLQFYSAFYALAMSAVSIGTPTALYLFYVALTAENMAPSQWVTPVTISIYVIICLLNVIIIRNLHYSEKGNNDINKD